MTSTRLFLALAFAVFGLALAGCGGDDESAADTTAATTAADTGTGGSGGGGTITGTVGPGFDISMTGTDGLTAGEYTIEVSDQSSAHNFHLTGPGVEMTTEVSEEGDTTWTVNLQAGEYEFVCDPHASQMNGSFTVG